MLPSQKAMDTTKIMNIIDACIAWTQKYAQQATKYESANANKIQFFMKSVWKKKYY